MAKTPFCLFFLRRRIYLSSLQQTLRSRYSSRRFSSLPNPPPPKPSNLSARLSFVFDQIDAIERDRAQKDEALHQIRNWRDSKRAQRSQIDNESASETRKDQPAESSVFDLGDSIGDKSVVSAKNAVELVHPWPEWIELMERLVQQNYFDHKRRDEGKMMSDAGFDMGEDEVVEDRDFDFTKDLRTVQVAGLNFGKDRFDIFRSLSRRDIQILVGYGCPTTDKKVVFSAKLLRKHVHFDEGDVCSSCSLRSSCERAYLVTNKEDEARTIDIMRVLMSFGFDHLHNTVTNKAVLKQKSVKNVVRKLLHEVVKLSAVPIDPNLPPPVIKKPPPKVKQPPPPPKRRVGRDDVEMKKGDWLCTKCDFMNFAKNAVCLQCDAKRPKRQLLPGEWECPECNFLNYRRNVVCFHCECKRPHDQFMEDRLQEPQTNSGTNPNRNPRRREDVSNAWNFDFDDDESDGADVAAFEYADPRAANNDPPLEGLGGDFDFQHGGKFPKKDAEFSDFQSNGRSHSGFDDFDDEDDDVDSYEVDSSRGNSTRGVNSRDFEEIERDLDFEDGSDEEIVTNRRTKSREFSDSEDDDLGSKEPSVHPDWRSSHVGDTKSGGRASKGRLSYGSDDDLEIDSDDDGFGSSKSKSGKFSKGFTRSSFDSDDRIPSRSPRSRFSDGSDDEISRSPRGGRRGGLSNNFRGNDSRSSNTRSRFSDGSDEEISRNPRGSRGAPRSNFRGNDSRNSKPRSRFSDDSDSDDGFSSRNPRGSGRGSGSGSGSGSRGASDRRSSFRGSDSRTSKPSGSRSRDDFGDGFSRGSHGSSRGRVSRGGFRGGSSSRSSRGRGDEEFERKPRGNFGKYDQGGDAEDFKNRRRVIER